MIINCFKCSIGIEASNFEDSYFYSKCETCEIVYWINCFTKQLNYINFQNLGLKFFLRKLCCEQRVCPFSIVALPPKSFGFIWST